MALCCTFWISGQKYLQGVAFVCVVLASLITGSTPGWSQRSSAIAPPVGPMRFAYTWAGGNCDNCEFIAAVGEITEGTPKALQDYLLTPEVREYGRTTRGKVIYFHSGGGSLQAGLELGRLIRRLGFNTAIAQWEPESAGTLAHISKPG